MPLSHHTLEYFLESYGYIAIFIGTFLEGETILVLGGLAAKIGHLDLKNVILTAFLGTTLGDQLYFFIGRRYGTAILNKRPQWRKRTDKIDSMFNRYDVALILSFRFMYGVRTVASFAFGMSSISTKKFIFLNMLGAIIWAIAVASAGYVLGHGMELLIDDIKGRQTMIFVVIMAAGAAVWMVYYWRSRQKA
jgi:membrane protein DedA with SNARE-associated domain